MEKTREKIRKLASRYGVRLPYGRCEETDYRFAFDTYETLDRWLLSGLKRKKKEYVRGVKVIWLEGKRYHIACYENEKKQKYLVRGKPRETGFEAMKSLVSEAIKQKMSVWKKVGNML